MLKPTELSPASAKIVTASCQSKDLLKVQTLEEIDSGFNPSVVDLGEGMTSTKPKVDKKTEIYSHVSSQQLN